MLPEEIRVTAIEYAKQHKNEIAEEVTDSKQFISDPQPISVFMAGSPGAGKTEFSKELLKILELDGHRRVVRIDGDELRNRIPGYTGSNSNLFQASISIIVDKIHDCVLHKNQTFILDGTMWKYEKAVENIKRSLDKNRRVFVFYIYQTPLTAWKFTQAREKLEGRNIPKNTFIAQFCGAKETIKLIREDFANQIVLFLVKKNFTTSVTQEVIKIIDSQISIDEYLGEHYTKENLQQLL